MKKFWLKKTALACGVVALTLGATAQPTNKYPQNYFRSPLDIPLFLAGNFAEIRPNHFHGGLDMKTESVEGKNIYAIADGFVSRIKISTRGYGKVLYVTHPNGYTSAYAHLQHFNDNIEAYVQAAQYRKETFEIELFPDAADLPVKQSDVIAISGNTGSSSGPHLHFEIRESGSEIPVNPLLFGFAIADNIKPTIKTVAVYPMNDSSVVGSKYGPQFFRTSGVNGVYHPSYRYPIPVHGEIAFGIDVIDKLNGAANPNGVYSIELLVDSQRVYYHDVEKVSFAETRYINCHVDYEDKARHGRSVQRSFLLPGNRLSTYHDVKNRGIVSFRDDQEHDITYIVKDTYGNTSSCSFKVVGKSTLALHSKPKSSQADSVVHFHYDRENRFETSEVKITVEPGSLYDDVDFEYTLKDTVANALAPAHVLHDAYTPLHKYMDLAVRVGAINPAYKSQALIVSLNNANKVMSPEGGHWVDDFMTTKTRNFGPYTVMIDSVKPRITPLSIYNGKNMAGTSQITAKISDNLSGIDSYRGTIDGKWILMEYEYKQSKLTYTFDPARVGKGEHVFKLVVKDERGNTAVYEAKFTR